MKVFVWSLLFSCACACAIAHHQVLYETVAQSNNRTSYLKNKPILAAYGQGPIIVQKPVTTIGFHTYKLAAPEFITFERIKFAFTSQCDLSLISLPTFGGFDTSLDVQARTTTVSLSGKTRVSSVAIKIASKVFELRENAKTIFCGKDVTVFPIVMDYNYTITKEKIDNVETNMPQTNYVISLEGNDKITFVFMKKTIRLIVEADNLMKEIEILGPGGMLGVPKATVLSGRNGFPVTPAKMGTAWQVRSNEVYDILFRTVQEPQFPRVCIPSTIRGIRGKGI